MIEGAIHLRCSRLAFRRRRTKDDQILHVGEPLPEPDSLLLRVPTLREPFTPGQVLAAVEALVGKRDAFG
jgi:hypothetical protein